MKTLKQMEDISNAVSLREVRERNRPWNKKFIDWLDNFLDSLGKKEDDGDMNTEPKPISFKASLAVVVALHVLAFYFMFAFDPKANASTIKQQDKEFLNNDVYVGVEEAKPTTNSSSSAPMDGTPKTIPAKPKVEIKYYTIKKGDTFYSISKNNKISITRLQKLNKIKDTSKIYVGQKLVLN